jgi:pyruvate,water dikinase
MAAPPLVIRFKDLGRESLAVAGGKAAALGELTRAGFPVPPGFCVTTEAYRRVAAGSALREVLEPLARTDAADVPALGALAARAREALLGAPLPEDVREACAAAYLALGAEVPVAVRSSATAEDLPDASFAGQHETFLNAVGEQAVLDAIRRCWASLFTERAVVYRARRGIPHQSVHLAVAVQWMVDASVAGVLFTADPVTGRRDRAVIDASPGLGESIVSGAVNPDHFVVDRATGQVLSRRLGDKRVRVEAVPGGGTRSVEAPAADQESCVTDKELAALCELGARVEAHAGAPQDIEWALDQARLPALLQSRPITTLYPVPVRPSVPPGEGARAFFSFNVAQGVFGPLTPMGLHAIRMFVGSVFTRVGAIQVPPGAGAPFVVEAGQRIWGDITGLLRNAVGRRLAGFALARMEARSLEALRALLEDPRFSPRPYSRAALARGLLRAMAVTRAPLRLVRAWFFPARARAHAARAVEQALTLAEVPPSATPSERLDAFVRLVTEGGFKAITSLFPVAAAGLAGFGLARRLLGERASREEMEAVLRALPHNPTTEMDLELWEVARRLREDGASRAALAKGTPEALAGLYREGALPGALQAGLAAFLERYGARGVAEIDLGVPRWSDEPAHILGSLANYLRLEENAVTPDEQFRRAAQKAEAAVAELKERARRAGRLRGRVVGLALSRARALAGLRESMKFAIVRLFGRGRRLLLEIGEALRREGRLDSAEDVFFLDVPELREAIAGADLRARIQERRAVRAREQSRKHVPRLLLSDGTDVEATLPAGQGLTGTPASAGRVTAVARVVLDPNGARLEPGEILVAPSTDPGWTPLFLTAGGLVMEMGGAMSHGAVVAREYGIPAVVGVRGATERIRTGQRITVDGGSGVVTPEDVVA